MDLFEDDVDALNVLKPTPISSGLNRMVGDRPLMMRGRIRPQRDDHEHQQREQPHHRVGTEVGQVERRVGRPDESLRGRVPHENGQCR